MMMTELLITFASLFEMLMMMMVMIIMILIMIVIVMMTTVMMMMMIVMMMLKTRPAVESDVPASWVVNEMV